MAFTDLHASYLALKPYVHNGSNIIHFHCRTCHEFCTLIRPSEETKNTKRCGKCTKAWIPVVNNVQTVIKANGGIDMAHITTEAQLHECAYATQQWINHLYKANVDCDNYISQLCMDLFVACQPFKKLPYITSSFHPNSQKICSVDIEVRAPSHESAT
jgi:hypothetical protein